MPNTNVAAATSPRRPVKRLVATIFVVALCFCAICGKVLLDARSAAWEHAAQVAQSLVSTLASDISRNIESYDLSLQGVIENLAYDEVTTISPELRQLLLFDRSATAKHLQTIALLDENGIVRLDARTPFAKPVDRSDRSYFQFHKSHKNSGLHISEPVSTRGTQTRLVVVSRRLSNPDGSFAGVVAGSVRLSYFQDLFKGAALGPHGSIFLNHTDGTQLARWPLQEETIGRNFKSGDLHRRFALARNGQYEATSVADGVRRLVVYSQVGDLPLLIAVGQSSADIYAQWYSYASMIGLVMLLLCATAVALALYLAREMGRRNAAEASLAVLATTDGLTGLSNRRHFNEAIDREWRRALRERTPLALVMCDSDHFKEYNDSHGHQAGDQLLQAIGAAMHLCIKRGADVAARYGGDEFAILLPGASADGAALIAEKLRIRLDDICSERGIDGSHLSMGVAAMMPMPGEGQSVLMAAADQALYRAKELGRNRIEVAPPRVFKPTVVEGSKLHTAA